MLGWTQMSTQPATSTSPLPGPMGASAVTAAPVAVPTAAAPPSTTAPAPGEDPRVTALRNVVEIVNQLIALVAAQQGAGAVQGGGAGVPASTIPMGTGVVGLNGIIGSPAIAGSYGVTVTGSATSPAPMIGGGTSGTSVHVTGGGATYVTGPATTVGA